MGFQNYIVKRILQLVPTIIGVTLVVFVLVHSAPGDPVTMFYGLQPGVHFRPEEFERIRHQLGLDRPLYIQYTDWLWKLMHGDLGYSYILALPVKELVLKAAMNTVLLSATSLAISISIGIVTGVISSVRQYSLADNIATTIILFLWSMPYFWLALLLIYTFSVGLGWLPTSGIGATPLEMLRHLILPASVLGTGGTALIFRLTRSSMLEILRQDYIVAARAKGLKERVVVYRHALKNALLPVTTVIGLYLGYVISGSAIIETIFAWPGMGRLMVDSSFSRDYPVIIGISLVSSVMVVLSVLITDLTYTLLDPRIRFE